MNESRGSESIGAEHVFHKHTDGSGKFIQGIVERHNAARHQVGKKSI